MHCSVSFLNFGLAWWAMFRRRGKVLRQVRETKRFEVVTKKRVNVSYWMIVRDEIRGFTILSTTN
jgi:hypothetical protein